MALAIDSSTPAFVANLTTGETTASFTPPVGSLLVVACTGTPFSGNPNFAVTSTGLTFTQQALSNVAGESTVTLFTAEVGAAGGSSRTVSCTSSGYASSGLKAWVVTGQHATQYFDKVATGVTGATPYNASITTDTDGNWVLGAVSDFADTDTITSSDTFEAIHSVDMSYMVVRKAAVTSPAGAATLNIVGARTGSAWAAISIRPTTYVPPATYKVADRGSAQNITTATSTSVAMAAAGSVSTGNYLVARIALDNSGTSGAAPSCTITDPRSNTWTVAGPANRTQASAANDGSTCYVAYAKVANAYTNGDSLTVNHSPTVPAKAVVIEEWFGIDGTTPVAVAATTATGSSTTPSISRTPTATGQLFYGALSVEGPTGDTLTQDADTTDGTWQTLTRLSSASGTAASNQTINGVAKLVTGTSAQTWNPTITTRDWAQVALVFAPAASGVTGTAAATEAADTSAASGQLGYSGTSARTELNDTSSATGAVVNPVTGTSAAAQAGQAATASGQLGYSGSLSRTQANQTTSASGAVGSAATGAVAVTQAAQTSTASGQLGYSGTSARSQANQTSAVSGQLGYSGTASTSQAASTSNASGTFTPTGISGTASATQSANTSSASGQLGYAGSSTATQASNTASASGGFTGVFTGTAAVTQAANTSAASGQLGYAGTASPIQAAQIATASGTFTSAGAFTGTAAPTQASQTATAAGKLGYSATAAPTQAGNTSAASGTVVNPVSGIAGPTQANQTAVAAGKLGYTGTIVVSQGSNTASIQGVFFIPITGTSSAAQANQTANAAGSALGSIVIRPDTGTTPRPSSGITQRLTSGITSRLTSGITPRPFVGVVERP